MEPTARVTIKRIPNPMNEKVFEIYIDGDRKMSIYKDETVTIDVEPGKHTIEIVGWRDTRSGKVPFTAEHNNNVNFECGYNGKQANKFIFVFVFSMLAGVVLFKCFAPASLQPYSQYYFVGLVLILYLLLGGNGKFVYIQPASQ